MTTFEILTLLIAGLALLVSLFNWRQQSAQNNSQQRLNEREVELVRIQLQRAQKDEQQAVTARLSARLFKDGKNWRVRVFNRGPSDARNVRVVVSDDGGFLNSNIVEDKFPMERMEVRQSVDLIASVHLQSPSKQDIRIIWNDASAIDRSSSVTLTR